MLRMFWYFARGLLPALKCASGRLAEAYAYLSKPLNAAIKKAARSSLH